MIKNDMMKNRSYLNWNGVFCVSLAYVECLIDKKCYTLLAER